MCFEYDGYYDVCTTMARRARKAHRCNECGQAIAAGERYLCTDALWDGEWMTHRQCRRCVYDRLRIRRQELADGCRIYEAEPPDGELLLALRWRDWQPTPCDQVPAEFDVEQYMEAEA